MINFPASYSLLFLKMGSFIHHFGKESIPLPAQNTEGGGLLPQLAESVQGNPQGMAEDGKGHKIVAANQ